MKKNSHHKKVLFQNFFYDFEIKKIKKNTIFEKKIFYLNILLLNIYKKIMKKITLFQISFFLLFCFSKQAFSESLKNINENDEKKPLIEVLRSIDSETVLNYKINSYNLKKVLTERGFSNILSSPKATKLLKYGAPDLPKFTNSVIISNFSNVKLEIIESSFFELENIEIAPSKGVLTRNIDPSTIPYFYGEEYLKDEFFPSEICNLREPYILRDYRAVSFAINAFRYNPVTKILRIYNDITVKISNTTGEVINPLEKSPTKISSEFENIYKNHFLNYSKMDTKYDASEEEGNMLIICYDEYLDAMDPFVKWKIQKGIYTEIFPYSEIGNSANAIKNYVDEYYENNGLTFLLFVGDAEQIPSLYSNGDSDVAYSYILGNDHYPDFFVGRFSAENIEDVETQVERTVTYEANPMNSDFYAKHTLIGSNQGGVGQGDDDETDFEHMQNIRVDLMGYNYLEGDELYAGAQGGEDLPGEPTALSLTEHLNEGRGFLAYVGHGSDFSFVTTGFNKNDVNSLVNVDKLPFIFDVACVNGNFHGQTCFAESWMRANSGGKPTGAVAIIASTINQSWAPPMSAQDEMVDIMIESYEENIKRTFGGITNDGFMLMNDEYNTQGFSMTDTWTTFGDPSLNIRTAMPTEIIANHNPILHIGDNQFIVNSETENAFICLTQNNEIMSTGKIENGIANISFEALNEVGSLKMTITAYNKIPYVVDLQILPNNSAYVTLHEYSISDENNNEMDFNETCFLNISSKNVGVFSANSVNAVLSTDDPFITINENEFYFGNFEIDEIIEQNNIFSVTVANNVPDGHNANFQINFTDELDNTWTSSFSFTINAPIFEIEFNMINDYIFGNNNGRLDINENVDLEFKISNVGHAKSNEAIAILSSQSEFITINNAMIDINHINANDFNLSNFNISTSENTPIATNVDFTFEIMSDEYEEIINFQLPVGLIIEDWESENFESYDWDFSGNKEWLITNNTVNSGNFAVKSGNISDGQSSILKIVIDVLDAGELSFYKKVSSEDNYDGLTFKIDGQQMGVWQGEVNWSKENYYIETGLHTFEWKYSKDGYMSQGFDCAFLDDIVLPRHEFVIVNLSPTFVSSPIIEITANSEYNYQIITNDFENDDLFLECLEKPEFLYFSATENGNGILIGNPTNEEVGEYNIKLNLSDGINQNVIQEFSLNVLYDYTNIEFLNKNENINIFPNPVFGNSKLYYNLKETSNVEIGIFDLNGKEILKLENIKNQKVGNYNLEIKSKNLEKATYIVKMKINNKIFVKKLIVL
ncbi:MAG: hypothetical protein B6I24_08360 [Bacteroidetes bacterium 4572_128]|nr:MAG: hypothetical protein B6I24_08360 [Bacteroidetes bacterium 4572_128]